MEHGVRPVVFYEELHKGIMQLYNFIFLFWSQAIIILPFPKPNHGK